MALRLVLFVLVLFISHWSQGDTPCGVELSRSVNLRLDHPGAIIPLKDISRLQKPRNEKAVGVRGAQVILADYQLLRADFDELREKTPTEIDAWLIQHAGFIAEPQAAQSVTNTPVSRDGRETVAIRPKDYGRALVFQTMGGLLDVKGAGALQPKNEDHSNGLATLQEVIREYLYSKLVRAVFEHSGSSYRVVDAYAVISLGFETVYTGGTGSPVGLVIRQAHVRARGDLSSLSDQKSLEIETILRRYGLTSAGSYAEEPFERINLQGTRDGAVIDFGSLLCVPSFEKDAYHFDRTPDESKKNRPLLSPRMKDFIQPDPLVRIPSEVWGFLETGRRDSLFDNPTQWSYRLAKSLKDRTATRRDVQNHFRNLLGPVAERWRERTPPFLSGLLNSN